MKGGAETGAGGVEDGERKESGRAGHEWSSGTPKGLALATAVVLALSLLAFAVAVAPAGPGRRHAAKGSACPLPARSLPVAAFADDGFSFAPVLRADVLGLASEGPRLLALEGCGREGQELRLVELAPGEKRPLAVRWLSRGAPLASGLAAVLGRVYVGTARLVLGGADRLSYQLSVTELAVRGLRPIRTTSLGRGDGVLLSPAGDAVLEAGGADVLDLGARRHVLARFPGFVIQHLALVSGGDVLLALFRPGAVPPAEESVLALVKLRSGRLVTTLSLPPSHEVESLAALGRVAVVAVSDGVGTTVEPVFLSPALRLGPRSLTAAGAVVLVGRRDGALAAGTDVLSCIGRAGRALVTARGRFAPLASATGLGHALYAVVADSLGRLTLPRACTQAASARAMG